MSRFVTTATALVALFASGCTATGGARARPPWRPAPGGVAAVPDSAAAPLPPPPPEEDPLTGYRNRFELAYRSLELGELDSEVAASTGAGSSVVGEVTLPDVEQEGFRVRYRGGSEAAGFHVGFVSEEFADTYELLGGEIGIDGAPRLMPDEELSAVIDYELTLAVRAGDGDVPVVDASGNRLGTAHPDLVYGDTFARLGGGLDWRGAQLTAGVAVSTLVGVASFDFESPATGPIDEDLTIDGTNLGGFVRARYRGSDLPLTGSVTGYFGDISGVGLFVGVVF